MGDRLLSVDSWTLAGHPPNSGVLPAWGEDSPHPILGYFGACIFNLALLAPTPRSLQGAECDSHLGRGVRRESGVRTGCLGSGAGEPRTCPEEKRGQ